MAKPKMMNLPEGRYCGAQYFATAAGTTLRNVHQLVQRKSIKTYRVSPRTVIIPESALLEYIEKRRQRNGDGSP